MSDHWDVYMVLVDDKPASIFLDMGIAKSAPVADFSELTVMRIRCLSNRPEGLPDSEEFDRIYELEEPFTVPTSDFSKVSHYVGRCCSDCHVDLFFYCSDAQVNESLLATAMGTYPSYEFTLHSRSDPEWSVYFDFLYPDRRQQQVMGTGAVLRNLAEHGDNSELEREVTHWTYFDREIDRKEFVEQVTQNGYSAEERNTDGNEEPCVCAVVSKTHATDYDTINQVVLELFDLCEEHNGTYDGWETSIKKP